MHRISITLEGALSTQIRQVAKRKGISISKFVRDAAAQKARLEQAKLREKTYQALEDLRGISTSDITDASATINETLYGEDGAWRGTPLSEEQAEEIWGKGDK